MAPGDPNRITLEDSLDRADALIAEGKLRVHNLHLEDAPVELVPLLEQLLREIPFPSDVRRCVITTGTIVDLAPAEVREIREIVGEALFNAARHAKAGAVRVEVTFGPRRFQVETLDDGKGFERGRAHAPEDGQLQGYGITSMRARAQSIGANLSIRTGRDQGSVITVQMPARKAYTRCVDWRSRFRASFRARKRPRAS